MVCSLYDYTMEVPADQTIRSWSFYDDPWGRKDSLLPTTNGPSRTRRLDVLLENHSNPSFYLGEVRYMAITKSWGTLPRVDSFFFLEFRVLGGDD